MFSRNLFGPLTYFFRIVVAELANQKAVPRIFKQEVYGTPFLLNGTRVIPHVLAEYNFLRHLRKFMLHMMPEVVYLGKYSYILYGVDLK